MRILATLLVKEFKQIFRNRLMLPIIFVVPVVQMILLTYAASLEMKGISMAVVDQDYSQASRLLVSRFEGSSFFEITMATSNYQEAVRELTSDHVDVILHMPHNFEKSLYSEKKADLQLVVNAINATEAGLINAYCTRIITDFNGQVRADWFGLVGSGKPASLETYSQLLVQSAARF